MNLNEIKNYFDSFCLNNNVCMGAYSFYYFYTSMYNNTTKNIKIYEEGNCILITYFTNEIKVPFLPLVKYNIKENTFKYLETFKKIISNLPQKYIKITFVPEALYEIFEGLYKLQLYDEEYIFKTSDFLNLSGSKLKRIRNDFNYFEKSNKNIIFKQLKNEDEKNAMQLVEDWYKEARERLFRVFDTVTTRNWILYNKENVFEQYNFILYINEKIVSIIGFIKRYPESKSLFCFNVKTNRNYKNATEYIFIKSLRFLNKLGFEYINYGGYLDMKGLKEHKERFRPINKVNSYHLILENTIKNNETIKKSVLM